jgi:hypothetical protein
MYFIAIPTHIFSSFLSPTKKTDYLLPSLSPPTRKKLPNPAKQKRIDQPNFKFQLAPSGFSDFFDENSADSADFSDFR